MELGSLEEATHNCIYISFGGESVAALNWCALIGEVKYGVCTQRAAVCLESSPDKHGQKKRKRECLLIARVIYRLTC